MFKHTNIPVGDTHIQTNSTLKLNSKIHVGQQKSQGRLAEAQGQLLGGSSIGRKARWKWAVRADQDTHSF